MKFPKLTISNDKLILSCADKVSVYTLDKNYSLYKSKEDSVYVLILKNQDEEIILFSSAKESIIDNLIINSNSTSVKANLFIVFIMFVLLFSNVLTLFFFLYKDKSTSTTLENRVEVKKQEESKVDSPQIEVVKRSPLSQESYNKIDNYIDSLQIDNRIIQEKPNLPSSPSDKLLNSLN